MIKPNSTLETKNKYVLELWLSYSNIESRDYMKQEFTRYLIYLDEHYTLSRKQMEQFLEEELPVVEHLAL